LLGGIQRQTLIVAAGMALAVVAAIVAGTVIITGAILKIKEDVNVGKSMSSSMKQDKIFPPVVVQMVSLGEESGQLDELFVRVSNFFDAQIDMTIGNLTSLLEPILILCLGLGVLTMALSVFLPMWNMVYIIKK
jgi:MSHA biogenesis protein MshG